MDEHFPTAHLSKGELNMSSYASYGEWLVYARSS